MLKIIPEFKRGALVFLVGLGVVSGQSWAQTAEEVAANAAARTAAQGEGKTFGNAARRGGPVTDPRTGIRREFDTLKPQTLTETGTKVGADNVWGVQYTGTVPDSLTEKAGGTSLISIGNTARSESVNGFTKYNNIRADQANQSNYFLSRGPVKKPTISPTEPWISASHASIASTPLVERVCKPTPPADTPAQISENTCEETYVPYIVPCTSQGVGVSFTVKPGPVVPANITSYSCPPSSGNTTTVLSGSSCTSTTTTTNDAQTNYTCPAGTGLPSSTGSQCILNTTSYYPAKLTYACTGAYAGFTVSGTTCSKTYPKTTVNLIANLTYSCPSGTVMNTVGGVKKCEPAAANSVTPAQVNYSCPAGTTLNGTSCVSTSVVSQPPTTNFGCTAGQVMSGNNCIATANQSATSNYYCPAGKGTLSGQTCVLSSTYPAITNYACTPGATLNGTNCTTTTPVLQTTCNIGQKYTVNMTNTTGMGNDACQGGDAVWAEWTCNGVSNPTITMNTNSKYLGTVGSTVSNYGESLVNIDGVCTARFTNTTICNNGTCNGSYVMQIGTIERCPYGGIYNGANQCALQNSQGDGEYITTFYAAAPETFQERSFGSASSIGASATFQTATTVNTTTAVPATLTYTCPQGGKLTGSTCSQDSSSPASIAYTCPPDYTLSGTACSKTSTTPATQTLVCNPGYTYNGSVCLQSTTSIVAATVSYSCAAGGVLSGTTCTTATSSGVSVPATENWSCTAPTILEGTSCVRPSYTESFPNTATPSYSCPNTYGPNTLGVTLIGSQCKADFVYTSIAAVSYSCPTGSVLVGASCNSKTVTTAGAKPNYACQTGFTLSGSQCTGKATDQLVETEPNGCGPLEGLSN